MSFFQNSKAITTISAVAIVMILVSIFGFSNIERNLGMIQLNHFVTNNDPRASKDSPLSSIHRLLASDQQNSNAGAWGMVLTEALLAEQEGLPNSDSEPTYQRQDLLILSEKYLEMGDHLKGLAWTNKIIDDYPDFGDSYYYRGVHLQKSGRLEEAEAAFRLVATQGYPLEKIGLSNIYLQWGLTLVEANTQNWEAGLEQFTSAYSANEFNEKDLTQSQFELAEALRRAGDRPSSMQLLQSIADREPSHFRSRVTLGYMYLDAEPTKSLLLFDEAIQLFPRSVSPNLGRALALERLGETDKAIVAYERVIEIDANNKDAQNALKTLRNK